VTRYSLDKCRHCHAAFDVVAAFLAEANYGHGSQASVVKIVLWFGSTSRDSVGIGPIVYLLQEQKISVLTEMLPPIPLSL
jgi:hypothetical protein